MFSLPSRSRILKVPNITHWRQTLGGLATADIKLVQVLQHMTRHKTHIFNKLPQSTCQLLSKIYYHSGVSISTDDRRNAWATLLREVGYFFSQEEAASLNYVMDNNKICSRRSVCNLV